MQQSPKKEAHPGKPHRWIGTASPLFDRCGITGCHAMRRYVNGKWTEPQTNEPAPKPIRTQQTGLWGEA